MAIATLLDNEDIERACVERACVVRACVERGVRRLRAFGSVHTDQFDANSRDLDFLVEFEPGLKHTFDGTDG